MKKLAITASLCVLLASCASIVEGQKSNMTIQTPGAENAKCFVQNQGHRYVAYSNQTISVMKSPHDFVVRCMASGNRERTVLARRGVSNWVFANVANGFVPGAAYDFLSRAAYDYPEEVIVSFVGVPIKPYPLPEYMNDGKYYQGKMEHYRPGTIVTESDRYHSAQGLKKKENLYTDFITAEPPAVRAEPVKVKPAAAPYDPKEEDK